ncbi:MAG: DUF1080 domain-containing protein [Planctomycetes bacterium]|nr:DUF1080 domain-containing protein [Planctomycetota bacterium]MBL7037518.1 DUF1080 domain-containing protein [Pirellulaceae bacterium]
MIAAGLAVLVVAVLLLLIVFLSSDKGQMVSVKIDEALLSDPNATVWLDGEQMEIADVGDTIELKPGEHRYEIRRGDEVIVIRGFKVEEGEPFVLQISAEAHQSLMNLAQRKTELWLEKGVFGPKDDMYWEDSGVYAQDDQSSSVQFTSMDVVKELMPAFLDSIDGVALGPHSARCQINGSIGLIVWDGSVQFRTRDGQSAGSTGVGIAIPRDGQWKEIAGVMGDWRLGPSDRYDPSNDDHVALQRLLDQAGEAMVRKDAEAIRRLSHPDWRGFIEGDDGPQVITSEAYTQENLHGMAVDKHQHTITNVKIDGPLAISLSQLDQIVDGRPVIAQGHLNFYARTKEGWRFLAWVAGDWTSVLTGRKGQGTSSPPLEPGFVSLFDGETLNGWEGDKTHYFVQDGLLVSDFGEQMFLDKSGGNLLTSREYGDFTLRLEFRLQPGANSGVLIRSSSSGQPKRDGMEIQVIDDSDPEFAEILRAKPYQRTASLSPVAPAQSGKLEPVGSWNELEITCQGRQLTVRLNASTVLDVNLDSFQGKAANGQDCPGLSRIRGRIGLLGFASRRRVEYRNIRIKELTPVPNQQLEPGFVSLFDGKTLVGWETWRVTGRNMEDPRQVPGGWDVQDGMLVCTSDQAGWLKSSRHYGDFVLQLEYRLPTGGNSGIFIRCPAAGHLSMQGMEIQIIDEQGQAFSPVRQEMRTGAIAHVVGPPRLSSAAKPPGEWNSVEIRCEGDQVQVSLNGISVVDASMMEFEELRTRPRSGFIGLSNWQGQARGTAFRNIRIKELTTSSASPTEPGFVSLFDGKTLNGWHGDPLLWRVVDGTIVGNTKGVEFDVHSYLCTEKKYRDFVLKVKFKLHEGNSGIQFRSEQLPDYIAAGYQAEIGWASTRKRPNEAMSLFFQGLSRPAEWMDRGELLRLVNEKDWNEYVITCRGRHITIQLNGRTTVDFMEDQPAAEEGVIGFQIMRRPEMGFADMKVEFKDIRIKELADLQDEQTEAGSGIRRGGRSESPRNRGLRKQALENRGLR